MTARVSTARPGASLLHPVFLVGLALLLVNDHVLKHACPGWVTGKLSDFAAMLVTPLFLQAAVELAIARARGRSLSPAASERILLVAIAATALVIALPEVTQFGDVAYRYGMGALQWPIQALVSLLRSGELSPLRPVRATADPSDLLALPMGWVAYRVGAPTRRRRRARYRTPLRAFALAFALLLALGLASSAHAQTPEAPPISRTKFRHDGFYLAFEAGTAALLLDSTASVSNGFQQPIASSARGLSWPSAAGEIGGTWSGTGLVIAARLGHAKFPSPVIETLGQTFTLREMELTYTELGATVRYFADPTKGLNFGGSLAFCFVERSMLLGGGGHTQGGGCASVMAGHLFWVDRQLSLGLSARLTAGLQKGSEFGTTKLLMPALHVHLAWH